MVQLSGGKTLSNIAVLIVFGLALWLGLSGVLEDVIAPEAYQTNALIIMGAGLGVVLASLVKFQNGWDLPEIFGVAVGGLAIITSLSLFIGWQMPILDAWAALIDFLLVIALAVVLFTEKL